MQATNKELEAWAEYEVGKPCAKHPSHTIKKGKWGNWCGQRLPNGTWCNGSWPTNEFLATLRKESHVTSAK